ncbi:MAG: extracellular solute-binding protein [Chloroflexi bacterium]|nr:extracellular solute-binding protein [Chloroflexota bacterium]
MKQIRWWWLGVVLLLVLGLAACGNEATPTTAPTEAEPTEVATETAEVNLQGVKVEFWHVWSRGVGEALEAMVKEFNETNEWGIEVVPINQGGYGEMFDKMNAAINSGELPNVVVGYQNQMLAWDMSGDIIADMNQYVNDPTYGLSEEEQKDFFPIFWEQDVVNGKRYGFPVQRSGQYMFYNVSWAKELGFDEPPRTPEEFYEQACAAYQANLNDDNPDNDGTGGWVVNAGASSIASWIWAFGGEIVDEQGHYTFDTPEAQEALTFLKKLYDDGCAWISESRYPNPEFATRQALFTTSSQAGIPYQLKAFEDSGVKDEWTLIPFPAKEGVKPVINVYGPSFAIIRSTPEQELASWLFIKWFTQPENQAKWIRASGYFPTRKSTLDLIQDYKQENPQWAAAVTWFESDETMKKFEPRDASWSAVRRAVGEYASQIFQPDFKAEQIPDLLKQLQQTAEELYAEFH